MANILDGHHYQVLLENIVVPYYYRIPLELTFKVYSSTGYGENLEVRLIYKGETVNVLLEEYDYEDITVNLSDNFVWTGNGSVLYIEVYNEQGEYLTGETVTIEEVKPPLDMSIRYIISELRDVLEEKGIPTSNGDGLLTLIYKIEECNPFESVVKRIVNNYNEPTNIHFTLNLKEIINGTRDPLVEDAILDPSNYTMIEGNSSNLDVDDGVLTQTTTSRTLLELPTDSTRWVLTFKLQLSDKSRWFIYFDKTSGSQFNFNYMYGMDVMRTGSPHCEFQGTLDGYHIPYTYSNVDFPRGGVFFDFTLIKYDNNYITNWLPPNESQYNVTVIPNTIGDTSIIGFWTWSGASFKIKDLEFYTL